MAAKLLEELGRAAGPPWLRVALRIGGGAIFSVERRETPYSSKQLTYSCLGSGYLADVVVEDGGSAARLVLVAVGAVQQARR